MLSQSKILSAGLSRRSRRSSRWRIHHLTPSRHSRQQSSTIFFNFLRLACSRSRSAITTLALASLNILHWELVILQEFIVLLPDISQPEPCLTRLCPVSAFTLLECERDGWRERNFPEVCMILWHSVSINLTVIHSDPPKTGCSLLWSWIDSN